MKKLKKILVTALIFITFTGVLTCTVSAGRLGKGVSINNKKALKRSHSCDSFSHLTSFPRIRSFYSANLSDSEKLICKSDMNRNSNVASSEDDPDLIDERSRPVVYLTPFKFLMRVALDSPPPISVYMPPFQHTINRLLDESKDKINQVAAKLEDESDSGKNVWEKFINLTGLF